MTEYLAVALAVLLAVTVLLVLAQRVHVVQLRRFLTEVTDQLVAAAAEVAYHQEAEKQLRDALAQLLGPDAVERFDQLLWTAEVMDVLDNDSRQWLEGQK